jgi:uncharacterized membrane protein
VVNSLPLASQATRLEQIIQEETTWALEANRRRQNQQEAMQRRSERIKILLPWFIFACLGAVAVWLSLFWRYGKPYPVQRASTLGEIPSPHPPALLVYLLSRRIDSRAIVGTLINLARCGYLTIREEVEEKQGWFRKSKKTDYRFDLTDRVRDTLPSFERDLLDFILLQAGDANGFWMSRFKKVAEKNRSSFMKWFRAWQKQVEEAGRKEQFFEPFSLAALGPNILCGVVIAGLGLGFTVYSQSAIGVPGMIVGVLQVIFSIFLTRRTAEGQRLYAAWLALKEHIRSIAKALGPVSLTSDEWARYLIASIVFGLHRKLSKAMEVSVDERGVAFFPWYVVHSSGGPGQGLQGMAAGITSMVTSISSTMSSASGTGGGASVGGGGGSGGGGGGAG